MLRNVLRHKRSISAFFARRQHLLSEPTKALDPEKARRLVRRCGRIKVLEQARQVHASILQSGVKSLKMFSKYIIRMYAACGSLEEARKVFETLEDSDLLSCTEIITAYTRNGHPTEALAMFRRMLLDGGKPDAICLLAALNACSDSTHLEQGKFIHALIRETGYEAHRCVGAALLAMYGRCGGEFEESKQVFVELAKRNAMSSLAWCSVMKMLIQRGDKAKALKLFGEIKSPQSPEFIVVLEACDSFSQVEEIHRQVITGGMDVHTSVGAALIGAYGRCGSVDVAAELLETMSTFDPNCWTKLISAYVQHGFEMKALEKFHEMQRRNVKPVLATFLAVIDACAALGALVEGRLLHTRLVEMEKVEMNSILASSLVNMYSKCGSLEEACSVFAEAADRDLNLWNTLMDAFSTHREAYLVLRLFQQMQQAGIRPDQMTFNSMLSVCCYLNLLEPGYVFFTMLKVDHGLTPSLSNYIWMIQLLGRAGRLEEAEKFAERSGFHAAIWRSYLAACRCHGDIERCQIAAARIFTLDPTDTSTLVVLSRIYARQGRLDMTKRMQKLLTNKAKQKPARSWIEIMAVVHDFVTGDESHPQAEEICAALEKLETVVESARLGQETDLTRLALHDVAEEDETCLWTHSERIAVTFGLMNTTENSPLVIFKNQRVCSDCHTVLAIISKLSGREIVVRDSSRFHIFQDGSCACGNYW